MKELDAAAKSALIAQVDFFKGCTQREIDDIAKLLVDRHFAAGDELCRQGEAETHGFVLVEGEAAVVVDGEQVATATAGDVVGELSIERRADPTRIALGSSLRVALRLRGPGNLWDAPDPLPEDALSGAAELFRLSPEQELQRGERLLASVLFRYDVVPRRPGPLLLPPLRIPALRPTRGCRSSCVLFKRARRRPAPTRKHAWGCRR